MVELPGAFTTGAAVSARVGCRIPRGPAPAVILAAAAPELNLHRCGHNATAARHACNTASKPSPALHPCTGEGVRAKCGALLERFVTALAGVLMLVVLSVMFAFASPYPKRAAWLKGTAVGSVLNDYDW